MRKRLVIIFLVGLGLVMLWVGLRRLRHTSIPTADSKHDVETVSATNGVTAIKTPARNPPNEWQRPAGVDDAGWKYMLTVRDMMLRSNQAVEFYARVIDQHGQPVPDAQLELNLSYVDEAKVSSPAFIHMKMGSEIASKPITLFSDEQGWFHLTGEKGHILNITGLSKTGYVSNLPEGNYDSLIFDPGGKRRSSVHLDMLDALNPNKGYTFHLWKKGTSESIVPISIGVNMNNTVDGQWVSNYFVRFIPPRVEWTNFSGADLQIQGVRQLSGNKNRPYEFTFTFNIPEGGIALSEGAYPYQAPTMGYQTIWSFENRPYLNPPDFPWTKTAYFKLRGGKAYAGVSLGFCKGGFDFSFNGYLNPTGSRHLEPDLEKLITDPEEIRRLDEQTRVK